MAITIVEMSMQASTPVPTNTGMQVAVVRPSGPDTVDVTINAQNGSVTIQLSAQDAAGLARELAGGS